MLVTEDIFSNLTQLSVIAYLAEQWRKRPSVADCGGCMTVCTQRIQLSVLAYSG